MRTIFPLPLRNLWIRKYGVFAPKSVSWAIFALIATFAIAPTVLADRYQDENLIVPIERDWFVMPAERKGKVLLTTIALPHRPEFVVFQVFFGENDPNLQAKYAIYFLLLTRDCVNAFKHEVKSFKEGPYAAVQFSISCVTDTETKTGTFSVAKMIQGADSLYVVQRILRGKLSSAKENPLTQELAQQWENFFSKIYVCDTRRPDAPCPQ